MPDWKPVPLDYEAYGEGTETFVASESVFDASSLGKTTATAKGPRQQHFLKQLENIAWHLGTRDVPVFVDFNGDKRRMDKGCIGHAVSAGAIESPMNGPDGYVVSVTLLNQQIVAKSQEETALATFKQAYRAYILSKYKQFDLTHQPGGDKAYYFKAVDFPPYMRLVHSFTNSTISLVYEGPWKRIASDTLVNLPSSMWLKHHDRTVNLVTETAPVDFTAPLEKQTQSIDTAIEAAQRLLPFAELVQRADAKQE
ncbi:hypothetical protein A5906_17380 [Bradyrhizobium sacchari]|uniref:Uncharacterized protein n=1 Tax=Bradyrhizobium sacchari TaxID=1399419 RepID=A0A560JKR9_9BRAD|nr:hypothetical protein [Bradyrhizobium sacchari]OPY93571.1 hypothetical protein A5906_17380 [Bradyrhizobium sacchari]TWB50892.1 hypothetical protein FBZ94_111224 [Bradyrhizobium sacchari]TWB68900.1 hypothetical protein FBZ95_11020 [Bradyrhizobium sacchari]